MLKKLVIAGAVVVAAAGMGLATPAYASDGDLVDVNCVGPTFGEKETSASTGINILPIAIGGDALSNLIHEENKLDFKYSCGNGPISNIGNTAVQVDKGHKGNRGRWRD